MERVAMIPGYAALVSSALVAVLVGAEAIALGALTIVFISHLAGAASAVMYQAILIGAALLTGLLVWLLSVWILVYHALASGRARPCREQIRAWSGRWERILAGSEPAPTGPLTRAAEAGLLDVRDAGDEDGQALRLLRDFAIGDALLARLGSPRLTSRLRALEDLARARLPEALPILTPLVAGPDDAVRQFAARAAARTLAASPPGAERDAAAEAFGRALLRCNLPRGILEEMLVLAQCAAEPALLAVLGQASPTVLRTAIESVGIVRATTLADAVAGYLAHPDVEFRAAALRALHRLGCLPERGTSLILVALHDDAVAVRVQAAHAAALLPPAVALLPLGRCLGDPSWWVRRAAALALLQLGARGIATLGWAAVAHSDEFGRDMAIQVLADARKQVTA
jgi:HEAT repeat protein